MEIDRQHRRIVRFINTLHDLCSSPDRAALERVMADTVDYTASHLLFEESLLEQAGYEFVGAHKRVHALFVRRVTGIHERFVAGEDVAQELHDLLSRWLFSHIRSEDHAYVDAVKAYMRRVRGQEDKKPNPTPVEGADDYADLIPDLEQRSSKKGWLQRLLGR